ncbi:hypothetical protein OSB04_009688 [Centaurea solstitialis]|uniref:Integrase catalytic domain-containing protein n=1 Tax=Centaurea solstitialis TaxID=347529 RepID=A0AA38T637_9ASTR|nr:hypothetical protein OSB04_009688 [Centaurea solstitialis]
MILSGDSGQIDGQSKRMMQTLRCMLRACVWTFGGSWDTYLSLAGFLYNNSFHASIDMPLYEMLCERRFMQKEAESIQWKPDDEMRQNYSELFQV